MSSAPGSVWLSADQAPPWPTNQSACAAPLERSGRAKWYAPRTSPTPYAPPYCCEKYGLTYVVPSVALMYAKRAPCAATEFQSTFPCQLLTSRPGSPGGFMTPKKGVPSRSASPDP